MTTTTHMKPSTADTHPCSEPEGGLLTATDALVRPINLASLVRKLESGDEFLLVMAMDTRRFETAHIAGSISFDTLLEQLPGLDTTTDIVIYCTDPACAASRVRASQLVEAGFVSVSRFAGGLAEWTASGRPLEVS